MQKLDQLKEFQFPYNQARFPGQATDEVVLYVTRESKWFLYLRYLLVFAAALALLMSANLVVAFLRKIIDVNFLASFNILALLLAASFVILGAWWVTQLWKKSLAW